MENKTFNYDFLISKGFRLIDNDKSEYFGDYSDIYSNDEIAIRFSSSKSFKAVDVASVIDINRWFDLALIMTLIKNEQDLSKVTTVEEHNVFLESNLSNICDLLSKQNYSSTKNRLELLEDKRTKQMFPNI